MRLFILPVSGGAFPIQLAFLRELNILGIKPDVALGSSGGNVAAYIGAATGWNPDNYVNIVKPIHNGMFLSSWWPYYLSFLPSYIPGYFKGSIYANGSGGDSYFKKMYTPDSVIQTEIWSGTLNRDTGMGQLFCNRNPQTSTLKIAPDNKINSFWIRDCMTPFYMDGNMDTIVKVIIASAAIPVIIPEQEINGQHYVDGGTLFSSPLTPLVDYILALNQPKYHLDYFSSFDIQSSEASKMTKNVYQNGILTIGELVKSICIQDRLVAVEFLRTNEQINFLTLPGNLDSLKTIENIRTNCNRSLLEFYPLKNDSMDLTSFTGEHIVNLMDFASKNYALRFWWTGTNAHPESVKISPEKFRDIMKIKPKT